MRRLIGLSMSTLIVLASWGGASVHAGERGSSGTNNGVTSHATLYFNGLTCNGYNKWQITKFSRYWTRTRLDRKVTIAHGSIQAGGVKKCDGTAFADIRDADTTQPFVAGIQQYTSGTTTSFVNWPYVGPPGGSGPVSAWMHTHVTTINDETPLGTICDVMLLYGTEECH